MFEPQECRVRCLVARTFRKYALMSCFLWAKNDTFPKFLSKSRPHGGLQLLLVVFVYLSVWCYLTWVFESIQPSWLFKLDHSTLEVSGFSTRQLFVIVPCCSMIIAVKTDSVLFFQPFSPRFNVQSSFQNNTCFCS